MKEVIWDLSLDNFFLFIGIDALDLILPKGELTRAGLGNTYSDGVGAIVGAYAAMIMEHFITVNDNNIPLWTNAVGIIIGCLLGVYIPSFITGKR